MSSSLAAALPRYERTTIADSVYKDLKTLLLSGGIPPGEKVTLRGLATAIGTSPMPVRDAVRRLVSEGALEMLPNRTLQVPRPTLERFREIVRIRCNLEGLAAEVAAEHIDKATLKVLREYAVRFESEGRRKTPDSAEVITANRLLHFTLYTASGMPLLVSMIEGLWAQIAPVFAYSMNHYTRDVDHWESFGHHARLLTALRQQDGAQARQIVAADIQDAALFLEQSFYAVPDHATATDQNPR